MNTFSKASQAEGVAVTAITYMESLQNALGQDYKLDKKTSLLMYMAAGLKFMESDKLLLAFKVLEFDQEILCVPLMVVFDGDSTTPYEVECLPKISEEIAIWMLLNRRGVLFDRKKSGRATSKIRQLTLDFCHMLKNLRRRQQIEDKIVDFLCSLRIIDYDQAILPFEKTNVVTIEDARTHIMNLAQEFEETRDIW